MDRRLAALSGFYFKQSFLYFRYQISFFLLLLRFIPSFLQGAQSSVRPPPPPFTFIVTLQDRDRLRDSEWPGAHQGYVHLKWFLVQKLQPDTRSGFH